LDGEIDRIAKDPLARHKESTKTDNGMKKDTRTKPILDKTKDKGLLTHDHPAEQHNNSSQHVNSSTANIEKRDAVPHARTTQPFTILQDVGVSSVSTIQPPSRSRSLFPNNESDNLSPAKMKTSKNSAKNMTSKSSDPGNMSSVIAADKSSQKASSHAKVDRKTILETKPSSDRADVKSSSNSFQIFTDSVNDAAPQATRTIGSKPPATETRSLPVSGKSNMSFQIFTDTATPKLKDSDKQSIMMASPLMGDDHDDGRTINTRLAMKDIDSMFCSPGMSPSINVVDSSSSAFKGSGIGRRDRETFMSARRPFIASNFESITGLQSDLSAIHEVRHPIIRIE